MSTLGSPPAPLVTRQAALRRRALRQGWLLLLVGLLIPVIALVATFIGWTLRSVAPRQAWALVALGTAVFVVRLAIYLG